MNHRLRSLIAVFFVVQIVLPFTAPLHVCDLNDLLGAGRHEESSPQQSPFNPTPAKEAEPETDTFVSPLEASTLSASSALVAANDAATGPVLSTIDLTSSPQVQQTVLRL